jgi:small redox-active disulfide protein 2
MKIEILGTGCAKCIKLEELVHDVVKSSGVEAEISKVKDIKQIMTYGVMTTPGLVINGEVKSAGKMPTADQIKSWLKA